MLEIRSYTDGAERVASARSASVSLVVPCFNEAARITRTVDALLAPGALPPSVFEIVFVDDGSTDGTARLITSLVDRHRHHTAAGDGIDRMLRIDVVGLPHNRGKGAAVRAGVAASSGDVVAFMDADLATDLEDLPVLIEAVEGAPVVIGSRAMTDSVVIDAPASRGVIGRTFNQLVRRSTGLDFGDTQCGFKAFRRDAADELFGACQTDGYGFDVEVLLRAQQGELEIHEVPVRWTAVPGSRVNVVRDSFKMLLEVIRIRWRVRPG